MRRLPIALGFLLFALFATAEPIKLTTDIFPPYQVREGDLLTGTSVAVLSCILRALNEPYSIRVMPWERAIHEVKMQRADGFFSASHMPRAEEFAQLSAPLTLEKWYWYSDQQYSPQTDRSMEAPRIGGVRGSNQVAWLKRNGYAIDTLVNNTGQLLRLLESRRIDAFLADQRTLRIELTQLPDTMRPRVEQFQQYTNLGVYFSNHFLSDKADFMDRFNNHVFVCAPEVARLDELERTKLISLHADLFGNWPANPDVIASVVQQNKEHGGLTVERILQLDSQWRDERDATDQPLINKVLSHPLSARLMERQAALEGLVSEIIVTDRHGLNLAASEITTDFWQGDEAKFSDAFFARDSAVYLGDLVYDQSTQSYQAHVSSQIRDQQGNLIGIMIVGLDIERALRMNGLVGGK
ncbi:MAG TPA: transporter substrate-binding domain-containing protein [Pseudomonas xinjiangensis]|uniref:Transporter substrate-binding domain-containing protein n=2 Tax=root TaxID=1 RepID=A0A7V1BM60_9GAMM|nr:transporter substrate-binding domain-containing protein [Halopseudomonas xinjiangensis]HEC46817.1 transporter substrate-binding domain-containing protein [Halopseudomonas xinjiangensis]